MKKAIILFLMMSMPLAVIAKEKTHIPTDNQECSDCHAEQAQVWLNGKHGLMNVKCVVCHGSPEENFAANPGINRCRGCHGEQVDQAAKRTAKAEKTCFPCHDRHSLDVKNAPKTPFHAKGDR